MADVNHVLVGMGGWDLKPFDSVFYPPKVSKGFRKLEYYSRYFDFVEINATFYNTSFSPGQVKRWLQDVSANNNFIFAVKLFKGFTHTYDATEEDLLRVHKLLGLMAADNKLAGLLMQFPYSFTNNQERRQYVISLSRAFRPHRLLVEVRHNSWNVGAAERMFEDNGLLPVNVDLPQIKRHMPLTNVSADDKAYFRMMGRNIATWENPWRIDESERHIVSDRYYYNYTVEELKELVQRIRAMNPMPKNSFVVFHNDPQAHSLVNGFQLRRLLRAEDRIVIPENLMHKFPRLEGGGVRFDSQ